MCPKVSGLDCEGGCRARGVAAEVVAAEAVEAKKTEKDPAVEQHNLSGRVGRG